jgi:hypothetical protein
MTAQKPTEKEEFEKSIVAKSKEMIDESEKSTVARCHELIESSISKIREDTLLRFNAIEGLLKAVLNRNGHKQSELANKILVFLGSNMNKPITLEDIIKNTMEGKVGDVEVMRLVSEELTILQETGDYGVGYFGKGRWQMVAKSEEPAPVPEDEQQ